MRLEKWGKLGQGNGVVCVSVSVQISYKVEKKIEEKVWCSSDMRQMLGNFMENHSSWKHTYPWILVLIHISLGESGLILEHKEHLDWSIIYPHILVSSCIWCLLKEQEAETTFPSKVRKQTSFPFYICQLLIRKSIFLFLRLSPAFSKISILEPQRDISSQSTLLFAKRWNFTHS